jgi:hypothetical protein
MQAAAHRLRSLAAAAGVAAVAGSVSCAYPRTDARAEGRVTKARHRLLPTRNWPTAPSTHVAWPKPEPLANADLRQRYRLDSVIGRGGFGLVHEGRDKRSDQRVAIKRICKQTTTKAYVHPSQSFDHSIQPC